MASLVAQLEKNQPATQETQFQSLGGDDPMEKEIATLSNILTWKIPWTEEPGRLKSNGLKESNTTESLNSREKGEVVSVQFSLHN